MRSWQICPLGPTGYGDSPYQCFSSFAGNPYLIDLRDLADRGFLTPADLAPLRELPADHVDFGGLYRLKWPLLRRAYENYRSAGEPALGAEGFAAFKQRQAGWLDDYAYFQALKDHHGGRPWTEWPDETRQFAAASRSPLRTRLKATIEAHRFFQYVVLLPMGAGPHRGRPPRHLHHWRHPDLRRGRLRRRLVAPGALRARSGHRPAPGRGRGAPRLLLRRRPALGQSALRLEAPCRRRLRLVARAAGGLLRAVRHPAGRSFPGLRRVLADSVAGDDGAGRGLDAGARPGFLPLDQGALSGGQDHRRGPGCPHLVGHPAARRGGPARHGRPAVRLRRHRRQSLPPPQRRPEQRHLPGHPRQRHLPRLVRLGQREVPQLRPAVPPGEGRRDRLGFDPGRLLRRQPPRGHPAPGHPERGLRPRASTPRAIPPATGSGATGRTRWTPSSPARPTTCASSPSSMAGAPSRRPPEGGKEKRRAWGPPFHLLGIWFRRQILANSWWSCRW